MAAFEKSGGTCPSRDQDLADGCESDFDPAKVSELYGYLHSGMWSGMPVLEEGLDIPDPHLHIGIDFNTEKTVVEGKLGITARIGTLLAAGLCVGIPALRWFLKYRKKMKKQTLATQAAA